MSKYKCSYYGHTRELRVPWSADDPGIQDQLDIIATESRTVAELEEGLKPHKDALVGAFKELKAGRPKEVDCETQYVPDQDLIRVVRLDTKEVVEERAATEDDRQSDAFSEEKTITLSD